MMKTQNNDARVEEFIARITDEQKSTDCLTVVEMLRK